MLPDDGYAELRRDLAEIVLAEVGRRAVNEPRSPLADVIVEAVWEKLDARLARLDDLPTRENYEAVIRDTILKQLKLAQKAERQAPGATPGDEPPEIEETNPDRVDSGILSQLGALSPHRWWLVTIVAFSLAAFLIGWMCADWSGRQVQTRSHVNAQEPVVAAVATRDPAENSPPPSSVETQSTDTVRASSPPAPPAP